MLQRSTLTVLLAVLCTGTVCLASSRLDQGWEEYRYKSWGMAEKAFKDVLLAPDASPRDAATAKFGLALVTLYKSPGPNPQKAADMLASLSKELQPSDTFNAAVNLFLGRALQTANNQDPQIAEAFGRVITAFPASLQAEEALIEVAALPLWAPTRSNVEKTVANLEQTIADHPGAQMLVLWHQYAGRLSMILGQWERGRAHLVKAVAIGLPNRRDHGTCLFQIAFVSDKYLSDSKTACVYYQRVIDEVLSDVRKDYCRYRIAALGAEAKKK